MVAVLTVENPDDVGTTEKLGGIRNNCTHPQHRDREDSKVTFRVLNILQDTGYK